MNWLVIILIILVVLVYAVWGKKYLSPESIKIEGYHTPLHYNKQLTPDIDNYKRLTLMPRSPTYRDY